MTKRMKYQVLENKCYNKKCFIPFSGNGVKIYQLYEMGQCPEKLTKGEKQNV